MDSPTTKARFWDYLYTIGDIWAIKTVTTSSRRRFVASAALFYALLSCCAKTDDKRVELANKRACSSLQLIIITSPAHLWRPYKNLHRRISVKLHLRHRRTNGRTPGIEFGAFQP